MKVAIVYGGKSGEHEVSLMSAASIVRHIKKEHKIYLIGISHEGVWHLQPDAVLENCLESEKPLQLRTEAPHVLIAPGKGLRVYGAHGSSDIQLDLVFPVLHGSFGEDGTVQGLLECADLAYVGADVQGSAIGMDKALAKTLWMEAGLPVVPFFPIQSHELLEKGLEFFITQAEKRFGWPVFVKPARTGSSVGTSKAGNPSEFEAAVKEGFRFDTKILVEPFMVAREIECSVIGNEQIRSFAPGEVIPNHAYYDYDAKYTDPDGASFVIPALLEPAQKEKIMQTAIRAYSVAGLQGMARVDFFVDKKTGEIFLNEVNTIPGFTSISMFPKMCEAGSLPYAELIDELFALAVSRKKNRRELCYGYLES